jgi:hypothetical protein
MLGRYLNFLERFFDRLFSSAAGRCSFGVFLTLMGVGMTWFGGEEFWTMASEIAHRSNMVTVTSPSILGPLLGPPIVMIGALIGMGGSQTEPTASRKVFANITIIYALIAIIMYPFSSPILRAVSASILEARGYVPSEIERTRPTSSVWTIKWRKTASPPPPRQP